jgi:hypothetical protein
MILHCTAGLVQHKVVVWLYFALELSVPAVLYSALSYNGSLVSILVSHTKYVPWLFEFFSTEFFLLSYS